MRIFHFAFGVIMKKLFLTTLSLFFAFTVYSQEVISEFSEETLPVLNEELRQQDTSIKSNATDISINTPSGIIVLWSGAITDIPTGWNLCDGTNGTPNLTDRFVIHADSDSGGTNDVGDTGTGTANHIHTMVNSGTTWNHTGSVVVEQTIEGGLFKGYGVGSSGNKSRVSATTSSATINHKPKYYALAYIQKL